MITLANLEQATEQEVFSQVRAHLLKQKKRSIRHFKCVFRTKSGLACAAGALMTDEEAAKLSDIDAQWDFFVETKRAPSAHQSLIKRLQEIHDDVSPRWWDMYLDQVAEDFKLQNV